MKIKLTIALLLMGSATIAFAQDQFTINGKLPQAGQDKIILLSYVNSEGKNVKDSAALKDGQFSISGITAYGNKAYLSLMPAKRDAKVRNPHPDNAEFYLEKGMYKVLGKDSISKASITGTKVQADYLQYTAQTEKMLAQFREISERFAKVYYAKVKDTVGIKKIQAEARPVHAKIEATLDSFIFSHRDSYVTLDLIYNNKMAVIDPKVFEPYYAALSKRVLASFTGQKMTAKYNKAKQLSIGKTLDFTQTDDKGNEFKLSSLKGKYVLVDFWASWCAPCRAENPNLLKAYKELKSKGFEIVGISLDETKAAWLRAVTADAMPWIQVSDLKGFQNDVAVKFGITAIPQNVLVNPEGVIVAKDLRGENVGIELSKYVK